MPETVSDLLRVSMINAPTHLGLVRREVNVGDEEEPKIIPVYELSIEARHMHGDQQVDDSCETLIIELPAQLWITISQAITREAIEADGRLVVEVADYLDGHSFHLPNDD